MTDLFDGFERLDLQLEDVTLRGRKGGKGPPLLLLHGFPQTHVHWHRLAPLLMDQFTLVMPDLPGYGDSIGRPPDKDHDAHSKRQMAEDVAALMRHLGHERFHLAGHDRGARVAYRMALDHPEVVDTLISFDTVPTLDVWEAMDWRAAIDAFHWPLLAQPNPLPEQFILADPSFFLEHLVELWVGRAGCLDARAMDAYRKALERPDVVRAMCEDYRAGAGIDLRHDMADREVGHHIGCPLLVLRGSDYQPEPLLPIWKNWAQNAREIGLRCGHFIAEEAPEGAAEAITSFIKRIRA